LQLDVLSEGDAETAATPTAKIVYSAGINSNSHHHHQQQHGQEHLTQR